MIINSTNIFIRKVRFYAYHGVLDQEKKVGAYFNVSMKATIDSEKAYINDELSSTLNYAEAYSLMKKEMEIPSKLIENVAYRIAKRIINTSDIIKEINIIVTKENPPMGAFCEGASAEITLLKDNKH